MDFSIEMQFKRVLPHINIKIIKFYFPNYHISLWPNGIVHVKAVGGASSNHTQEPFITDWTL